MAKPFVIIELDRPRKLRYGMNSMVVIEDLTGLKVSKIDFNNIGFKELRSIAYAGLCHEDKTLTPEGVGELIDEYSDVKEFSEKMAEAINLAFNGGKNV